MLVLFGEFDNFEKIGPLELIQSQRGSSELVVTLLSRRWQQLPNDGLGQNDLSRGCFPFGRYQFYFR